MPSPLPRLIEDSKMPAWLGLSALVPSYPFLPALAHSYPLLPTLTCSYSLLLALTRSTFFEPNWSFRTCSDALLFSFLFIIQLTWNKNAFAPKMTIMATFFYHAIPLTFFSLKIFLHKHYLDPKNFHFCWDPKSFWTQILVVPKSLLESNFC